MEREIKFRVWDGLKMRYFDLSDTIAPCEIEIMQYTGLKDRDGKEIYEGDIVRVPAIVYKGGSGVYDIYSIRFAWGSFYLYDLNSGFDDLLQDVSDECEIIGNIHEHPELLKQQTTNTKQQI